MPSLPSPWMRMTDGVLVATFNDQGGPSGVEEFRSTNWFMGMASRTAGPGRLTLTGMISLEPATATERGYGELFQVGEAYHGVPIVDRQHPHNFLMQASASYRFALTNRVGLTLAGAPVGEPALGPVAFMHRASAADNPAAPLSHHTLDSTHVSEGVVTAALDRGAWTIESSIFNGREPDDCRWRLMEPGALDSWSARVWFRPSRPWQFQVSHGFLRSPEALEPGDLRRTTASGSWLKERQSGFTAVTVAYGRNDKPSGAFNALLAEVTSHRGDLSLYGRLETLQVETALLESDGTDVTDALSSTSPRDVVTAVTAGGVRDFSHWRRFEIGGGADVTTYVVPDDLRPTHGDHPVSFHVFLRIRPPAGHMGRMWNMRMAQPLGE